MIDYGFQAVRDSLKDMERFHAKSVLARGITKTMFRAVDRLPLLKSTFLADGSRALGRKSYDNSRQ
jgi:hypothetical protein